MTDVLPSWTDGPTRDAITAFVEAVSSGPDALPEADRIAVFDNDGTLWTEKPMPTQLHYLLQQWAAAAKADPSLADRQPYLAASTGDFGWLGSAVDKHYAGDDSDLGVMIAAISAATDGVSVDDYERAVATFYSEAEHLTLKKPYSFAIYQPMIELLRYLEAHAFTVYIVSGGDRDFMRPMTVDYYGIPPERVIGTAFGLTYDEESNEVRYGASLDYFDDGPLKPVRIWTRTGKRPILAAGNSNGDLEMLRFTLKSPKHLGLLVHHDDDTGRGDAPYDKGTERALEVAADPANGITVVSVKSDWAQVFPEG